jgi:hypothetical protein
LFIIGFPSEKFCLIPKFFTTFFFYFSPARMFFLTDVAPLCMFYNMMFLLGLIAYRGGVPVIETKG